MLTQTMALELAQYGIRVKAIAPGYTPYKNSEFDSAIKDILLGRSGLPIDQTSTALFLATEESSWMTGQILTVDGRAFDSYFYSKSQLGNHFLNSL